MIGKIDVRYLNWNNLGPNGIISIEIGSLTCITKIKKYLLRHSNNWRQRQANSKKKKIFRLFSSHSIAYKWQPTNNRYH